MILANLRYMYNLFRKWAALPELLMKNHILDWHHLLYTHHSQF